MVKVCVCVSVCLCLSCVQCVSVYTHTHTHTLSENTFLTNVFKKKKTFRQKILVCSEFIFRMFGQYIGKIKLVFRKIHMVRKSEKSKRQIWFFFAGLSQRISEFASGNLWGAFRVFSENLWENSEGALIVFSENLWATLRDSLRVSSEILWNELRDSLKWSQRFSEASSEILWSTMLVMCWKII